MMSSAVDDRDCAATLQCTLPDNAGIMPLESHKSLPIHVQEESPSRPLWKDFTSNVMQVADFLLGVCEEEFLLQCKGWDRLQD
jgi:hypothetical protein